MRKLYSGFLLFFLFSFTYSQLIVPAESTSNRYFFEEILRQSESYDPSQPIEEYLAPLKNHSGVGSQILYCGLKARLLSASSDGLTPESIRHFEECIETAKKTGNKALELWANLNYVGQLYKYRKYLDLKVPLLESMKLLHEVPAKEVIEPNRTYRLIGWILQTLGDQKEARLYLAKYKNQLKKQSPEYADALDYLGQTYLSEGNLDEAKKHFIQAVEAADRTHNQMRKAKALGNLGTVHFREKDYDKAVDLLKKDIQISSEQNDHMNFMFANVQLAKIYLENNQFDEAQKTLDLAKQVAQSKSYYRSSEQEILTLQLKILQKNSTSGDELEIRRRLQVLQDSLKYADSEATTASVSWSIEKARYSDELASATTKVKREEFFKNLLFVLTVFLGLFALYQYLTSRKKMRLYNEKVEYYERERLKFEEKYVNANPDYESQVEYIRKKNNQIHQLNIELEKIESNPINKLEKKSGKLRAILQSHLMTDENWQNFKTAFVQENPKFLPQLNQKFPEITESNLRIIFLQKLGYSNNETAELLGITVDAVKKSKQRLRKKLGHRVDELEILMAD